MKKIVLALAALSVCLAASAQTRDAFSTEFGGRLSVGIDKKIVKGWHVYLSEEVRMDDNFKAFDRFHTTLGTSYKPLSWLKVGLEYSLINHYKPSSDVWHTRHRGSFYLSESIKAGLWTLSFKETLYLTYKAYDINVVQEPKAALQTKLRFQAKYRGWGDWRPYAGVEGRFMLNGTNGTIDSSYTYFTFSSYSDAYFNRMRGFLGLEWKLSSYHSIDFRLAADYNCGVELDVKSDGTTIKSFTQENKLFPWLKIGYTFNF